ncbi:hypothetical protein SNEBB_011118 [Seison nebaliae]|nr:hypothetical protein SNEBB_011118 [Seison nebaliae]
MDWIHLLNLTDKEVVGILRVVEKNLNNQTESSDPIFITSFLGTISCIGIALNITLLFSLFHQKSVYYRRREQIRNHFRGFRTLHKSSAILKEKFSRPLLGNRRTNGTYPIVLMTDIVDFGQNSSKTLKGPEARSFSDSQHSMPYYNKNILKDKRRRMSLKHPIIRSPQRNPKMVTSKMNGASRQSTGNTTPNGSTSSLMLSLLISLTLINTFICCFSIPSTIIDYWMPEVKLEIRCKLSQLIRTFPISLSLGILALIALERMHLLFRGKNLKTSHIVKTIITKMVNTKNSLKFLLFICTCLAFVEGVCDMLINSTIIMKRFRMNRCVLSHSIISKSFWLVIKYLFISLKLFYVTTTIIAYICIFGIVNNYSKKPPSSTSSLKLLESCHNTYRRCSSIFRKSMESKTENKLTVQAIDNIEISGKTTTNQSSHTKRFNKRTRNRRNRIAIIVFLISIIHIISMIPWFIKVVFPHIKINFMYYSFYFNAVLDPLIYGISILKISFCWKKKSST